MCRRLSIILVAIAALGALCGTGAIAENFAQSRINPAATTTSAYPRIVLYSTSWCPHCKKAKEYFTRNNIPFINRDVEVDSAAMEDLTKKYKSQGVPVLVLGDDEKILKGFDPQTLEKAVKELQQKKK